MARQPPTTLRTEDFHLLSPGTRAALQHSMPARSSTRKPKLKTEPSGAPCVASIRRQADWQGLDSLSDEALIALILARPEAENGGDEAIARARRLMQRVGGLSALCQLRPHAHQSFDDLDSTEAGRLAAALQLGLRVQRDALLPPPNHPFNSEMVIRWARSRLAGLEHEEVWVLCVNSHTALRSAWQVGRGGIHGCGLLARDILVPVVRDGASGFILVHNHPSGDPTPSPEDMELTRGLSFAASSLCIPLLDHVVVARSGACSFFELGYLGG